MPTLQLAGDNAALSKGRAEVYTRLQQQGLTVVACAGGAAARSSAVRSRVRSAGARQRRGGASADGSPRAAATPQELRENAQVPLLVS